MNEQWKDLSELDSKSYTCGYCGERISSNVGYYLTNQYHSYINQDLYYHFLYNLSTLFLVIFYAHNVIILIEIVLYFH